jgi:hypothetical protein
VTRPLDDEQGAGILDATRALIQYQGGEQKDRSRNAAGVRPIGWNRGVLAAGGVDIYDLKFPVRQGAFITATVTWDRELDEQNYNAATGTFIAGDNQVQDTDRYVDHTADLGYKPEFDLQIYKGDRLVAESTSPVDNIQHLHIPVPNDGSDYQIRVELLGNRASTRPYNYSVAWWTSEGSS